MDNEGFIDKPVDWNNVNLSFKNEYDKINNKINLKKKYDVVFILAGGFNSEGIINEWVKRRLDLFINIYNDNKDKIKYVVCLGGGTYHRKPILTKNGYVIHESTGLVKYLLDNGIDKSIIMREWFSYDTIANGYFSYVNFSKIRNWKNIIVITSNFHLLRTKFIFNWIYSMENKNYNIKFIGVSDEGIDREIISIRKEREKNSIINLIKLKDKIKNIEEFHKWFHNEHNCYNCNITNRREKISNLVKLSY